MTKLKGILKRWRKRLIILGGIVLLLVIVFSVSVAIASKPSTCSSCHEIKPAYDQWHISSHYGVSCIKCHKEPGVMGYIKMVWNGSGNLIKHVTGSYEYPPQTHIKDDSCIECHALASRPETLPQASLRIAHSKHVDQTCDVCHVGLVHTELVGGDSSAAMTAPHVAKTCTVCHTPDNCPHGEANVACVSCHKGIIPNHELGQKRGVLPRASCIECHESLGVGSGSECRTCHFSPHGIDAACNRCHSSITTWTERSFQHPVTLTGRHAELKCDKCHTNGSFTVLKFIECGNCHQPPHSDNGKQCGNCHKQPGEKWSF